jgi:hypothetical protein
MSDCQRYQEEIVTTVAPHGGETRWSGALGTHLDGCPTCREVADQELALSGLLSEPLPLPPADLIPGVMSRIRADAETIGHGPAETALGSADLLAVSEADLEDSALGSKGRLPVRETYLEDSALGSKGRLLVPETTAHLEDSALPWAERLAWAASGAAAMFFIERMPSVSTDWLGEAQAMLGGVMGWLWIPFEVNGLYLAVTALVLLALQGAMIYQVKASAS